MQIPTATDGSERMCFYHDANIFFSGKKSVGISKKFRAKPLSLETYAGKAAASCKTSTVNRDGFSKTTRKVASTKTVSFL